MTFSWKNGRQLATLSKAGTSASYKYDDSGVRTSKTVNGVTTNYYRAGNLAVGEISTERGLEYILDANGGIYGIYYRSLKSGLQCGDTYYFAYNAQGDVIGLIGSSGRQFASYSYDERGNCTVTALMPDSQGHAVTDPEHVAFANPFRYRGYYFDVESGLYYLGSRYYDPVVGRFINADALLGANEDVLSYNLYAYCGNNPISRYDDGGLFWKSVAELFLKTTAVVLAVAIIATATVATGGAAAVVLAAGGTAAMASTATAAVATVATVAAATSVVSGVTAGMALAADAFTQSSTSGNGTGSTNTPQVGNTPKNIYGSVKNSPNYPHGFRQAQNGYRKVKAKNWELVDQLKKSEGGKWWKVYQNGYDAYGNKVSLHYFQSDSGKVFDLWVCRGRWS